MWNALSIKLLENELSNPLAILKVSLFFSLFCDSARILIKNFHSRKLTNLSWKIIRIFHYAQFEFLTFSCPPHHADITRPLKNVIENLANNGLIILGKDHCFIKSMQSEKEVRLEQNLDKKIYVFLLFLPKMSPNELTKSEHCNQKDLCSLEYLLIQLFRKLLKNN